MLAKSVKLTTPLLFQVARFGVAGGDDRALGRQQPGNRCIDALEVTLAGKGHPWQPKVGVVVRLPLRQQLLGVLDVDFIFREAKGNQPFLHGDPIILAQTVGDASGFCVVQVERVRRGRIDGVVGVHIDAGREEGALADDLQRRLLDEQRIDEHDKQRRHQDGEADYELAGVKYLVDGVFHGRFYP
jgi:hypothetical protein